MRAQRCESPVQALVGLSETNNNKIMKNYNNKNECAQILMYLDRLQHLVPNCPKDKPIGKLELIQKVIDYIYDLECVLNTSSDLDKDISKGDAPSP